MGTAGFAEKCGDGTGPRVLVAASGEGWLETPNVGADDYLLREGTRRLLEETGDVTITAAVGTAPELLDAVTRLAPHAVVTDIRMPPGHHTDGIDAAHTIRVQHPDVGVVVLSQHADEAGPCA